MLNIAVIPARGGSKGIPNKNLVELSGKALIDYTIEAALAANKIDRIILTTDSEVISSHARARGIEVPSLRPADLSSDESTMEDVLYYLVKNDSRMEANSRVVLLQPTSPLRTAGDIDSVIGMHQEPFDTVVSVSRLPHNHHPDSILRQEGRQLFPLSHQPARPRRRQDTPSLYARNGPAVVSTRSELLERRVIYGACIGAYEMPGSRSVDINSRDDLVIAEALVAWHARTPLQ